MLELLKIELNIKAVEDLILLAKTDREKTRLEQLRQSLIMQLEDFFKMLSYEAKTQTLH